MTSGRGFWRYVSFGILTSALTTALFSGVVAPRYIYPNPEFQKYDSRHQEYQRRIDAYNGRVAANRPQINRRQFEEALAGVRPLELVQDHNFRRVAGILRPDTPSYLRLRYLRYTFEEHQKFDEWISACADPAHPTCILRPELSVLDQPMQLQALLSGDVSAIHAPAIEQPPVPREAPPVAPSPVLPAPDWVRWLTAAIAAMFFSIGYVLCGLLFCRINSLAGEDRWLHPMKNRPPFSILGWLVWTAALPGLAVILFIQFLFTDLQSFAGRFTKKKFRDEFERLESVLAEMKSRAAKMGNKVLEDQIDKTSERVRVAQTREQLTQLGASLDAVRMQLEAIDEVDVLVTKR